MDIVIRRAEPTDYEAMASILGDPLAYPGTLQLPYPSREMWRKRLAEMADGDFLLLATIGDEIVGQAGLHSTGRSQRRSHALMLGLTVASAWQGKGIGKALLGAVVDLADGWLNVFRLELTVYTDNDRAMALYREFGFEIEGTHRAYALRDGRYADVHSMARIKQKPVPGPV
jgi:L-phenylalanine/L-methionine N-acetyltransferase